MTDISSSRVNWLGKFFPRDYPVQNISPANKMKIYLSTHPNLNDKRVGLIVAEKIARRKNACAIFAAGIIRGKKPPLRGFFMFFSFTNKKVSKQSMYYPKN